MEAKELVFNLMETGGPDDRVVVRVVVRVVDRDHEYWLDITGLASQRDQLKDTTYPGGVIIEAKPLAQARATRPITNPRPYFQHAARDPILPSAFPGKPSSAVSPHHGITYMGREGEIPDCDPGREQKIIDDIACKSPEQLKDMQRTGEFKAVYGIDPGESIVGVSKEEFTRSMTRPETTRSIEIEPPVRKPLLPAEPIEGTIVIDPFKGVAERIRKLVTDHLGRDPYESEILRPRPGPIVGKVLHDANPSIPDLSEAHYQEAREINRQEVLKAFNLPPDTFIDTLDPTVATTLDPTIQPVVMQQEKKEEDN